MLTAPGETRIRALRLRAPEDCRRTAADVLERADWSFAPADEVLILRRIRVSAPLAEIGGLAIGQARQQAARAVHGRDARADRAEAVRFASRADLIACLLADLLGGRERWFWRGWRELFGLPPGLAAARLIAAEPLHWPAVVSRLKDPDEQAALWQALTPADARVILSALERATGWPVARSSPPPHAVATEHVPTGERPAWLSRARAVLAARAAGEEAGEGAGARLAVVTWLWQAAPQRLAAEGAAGRIAQLAQAWLSGPRREGPAAPEGRPAHRPEAAGAAGQAIEAEARRDRRPAPAGADRPPRAAGQGPLPAGRVRAAPGPSADGRTDGRRRDEVRLPPPDADRPMAPSPADLPGVAGGTIEPAAPTGLPAPAAETRFVTRQGGWFLLLNVLALPAVQARLQWDEDGTMLARGWLWLYRLGRALGGLPDPPLADFLAGAAGLADAQALAARPPLPCEDELVRLAQARYGEAACNAGLLSVPALVLATPSHLDVHYRMSDVRLEVRRVALDVDPGWLPWLGRVVSFHYGQPVELAGLEAGGP